MFYDCTLIHHCNSPPNLSQQERRVERSERLLRDEEEKRKKLETKVAAASTSAEAIGKELDDALKARDVAKRESDELKTKVRERGEKWYCCA